MIKSGNRPVNESTYDGDTINWNKISAGDVVGWTIEGMGKLPKVGDDFRVGPFVGKCTKVSGSKVYMKIESDSRELNESGESINESAKIRSMTKQLGQAYSGCWQLPSGKPGMITSSDENDIEMVLCGSEKDGLQLIMTLDDGDGYFKDYKWDAKSEATAVHHFQEIAKIIDNEFIDLSKVAKKFGLKSM